MASARLLIVDDDPSLRQFLRTELELEGYSCQEAASGQQALALIRGEPWDLLLLDWTLPDFSGVEICRRLRASHNPTPVLMLTGIDGIEDRVKALDAGADDYMVKPFSIEELLARLRALQRRATSQNAARPPQLLRLANLELNTASREVRRGDRAISLSARNTSCYYSCCCRRMRWWSGRRCWLRCGARTSTATPMCWMCTSATCARSLNPKGNPP